jgi:malto-oligosyltrehalose trehalohydrolase
MEPAEMSGAIAEALKQDGQKLHRMPFGAELLLDGSVRFRVWAPEAAFLHLALEGSAERMPMARVDGGWHELVTAAATAGSLYRFVLPNGMQVPDPASRFQPRDVNGPSEVIDPAAYRWRSVAWKGCPWEEVVLYEMHMGTFTPEGTFLSAIERLEHLAALGVTGIEIMSIGDFPGRWDWGYDGVLLYAPDSSYGRPEDLKAFVDAAHEHGMMVLLDVVYNHFGPEGNYIPQYFPDIVTNAYETPWGQALNFDAKHSNRTREFVIHNALYWVEEFQMDGLRLDAVHAILDSSSNHILDELAHAVKLVAGGREIHLILESDDRVWHHLGRDAELQPLSSTAQWNHDMQKLVALALTSGRPDDLDYADTILLGKALVEGFTSGPHHQNAPEEVAELSVSAAGFISFLQSHDVIGNRIAGERITQLAPPEVVRAIASVYLLAPQIPMLFMGEEWGASTPFPYFCDFTGELASAVRRGRLEQFATPEQRADPQFLATVCDPVAESTFLSAKLQWGERLSGTHATWLDWYRGILETRRKNIVPLFPLLNAAPGQYDVPGPRQIAVQWKIGGGGLRMRANLSDQPSALLPRGSGRTIWLEGRESGEEMLGPWSVHWSIDSR